MVDRDTLCRDLGALVGSDAVRRDAATLDSRRCDYWSLSRLRLLRGELTERPACVVTPADTEAVRRVLRYANEKRVPVVPFGAGSGVCGGVLPDAKAIVLDLGARMNRLLEVNETALLARVQAGMLGGEFEAELNKRSLSCGHFPQSIDVSSVGGWVATRAAGQYSTRYGSIEDRLVALEVVLADGTVVNTRAAPRFSTGPDLRQIFLGAEGTLGVVTELLLKLHPLPPSREPASFLFRDFGGGLEAIRKIVQAGWAPPVVRLYDAEETGRHFPDVETGCLLLLLSEGPTELTTPEIAACARECVAAGGVAAGAAPVERWLQHRNAVPGFEPFLEKGLVLDTIEVAATWDLILGVYDGVVSALKGVPGLLVGSGHSSHSYTTGTNIYFTFVAQPGDPKGAEALYRLCWNVTMEATLAAGGTIAHHHGIGRVRRDWMRRELGTGLDVLQAIKRALDPNGILNPGVLLPS